MEQNAIGKRIMELRKKHKMTRKALSNLTGIKERSIAAYERGENRPSAEFIEALSAHFGINPTLILRGDYESPSKFTAFLRKYKFVKKIAHNKLSELLGIDIDTLEKWLINHRPEPDEILLVSEKLHIKPFDLFRTSNSSDFRTSTGAHVDKMRELNKIYPSTEEMFADELPQIDEHGLIEEVNVLLKYAPEPFLENLKIKLLEFKKESSEFFA